MKTIAVPVEPTEEMRLAGCNAIQDHYRGDGGWCGLAAAQEQMMLTWRAMLAAAPPQNTPDQQAVIDAFWRARGKIAQQAKNAAPDSRERAIMPCANLTGCETPRDCSEHGYCRSPRASAPQHEHYDGQNECTICDKAESERTLAKRNAAAKGSVEDAQTVNGSARDADAGSSNAIQDPSFAAPHYHICYSVNEDRAHCVTCGRELPNLAVSAAPNNLLKIVGPTCGGFADSHLREQIAGAQARQAKGEGIPGDAELAHYDDKEPERRVAQRRVESERDTERPLPARRQGWKTDRRQNAAGQDDKQLDTKPSCADADHDGSRLSPVPAAPASKVPTDAQQIDYWFNRSKHAEGRAIELEQRVAELEATIARDDENINDLAARECKERQRAEKAEAELAELTLANTGLGSYLGDALEKLKNVGAELAELKARVK